MSISVHDNWVYGQAVDYQLRRIVLHTVYPHSDPTEFTDVTFEGVVVHHFEQQKMQTGENPAVVLFDVTEEDPSFILGQYSTLLARTKNYGWPLLQYTDLEDLAKRLSENGARCFEVHGTCGSEGFVFAASMTFTQREGRALVGS